MWLQFMLHMISSSNSNKCHTFIYKRFASQKIRMTYPEVKSHSSCYIYLGVEFVVIHAGVYELDFVFECDKDTYGAKI